MMNNKKTERASKKLICDLWDYESFYGSKESLGSNRFFDKRDIKQMIADHFLSVEDSFKIKNACGIVLRDKRNASIFFNRERLGEAWRNLKK